jgi:glycosyltransferase involved in cell wall biosynthesis
MVSTGDRDGAMLLERRTPSLNRPGGQPAVAPLRLLTLTTLYPNAARPSHGVFVENRLRHLVATGAASSTVIAPVPWFPSSSARFGAWSTHAAAPAEETRHGIRVLHPRFLALPRIGMYSGPAMLLRAMRAAFSRLVDAGQTFDAIDAHYLYPDGVAALELGRACGLPVVITARGSDTSLLPRYRFPRRLIKRTFTGAAALVAVSDGLAEGLRTIGAPSAKVTVLRNGVDLDAYRPRADRAAARAAHGIVGPLLLSVGQLIPRKGHHHVIAALAELPAATLWIVGEGPERAALEALALRLGLRDQVRLLGLLPPSELPPLYGVADALVLASEREGWANVMLEAMACGTPVIAGPAWGSREAISVPAAGSVLDVVSPGAIAAAARSLLAAPPDHAATRAHAEAFSWASTSAGQLALFRTVVARHRAAAPAGLT